MKSSKAAVITFPGSNCDDDCVHALRQNGFEVQTLWHKDAPDLSKFKLVVLPGGFSYGDYLRSGAMAAHSPILQHVRKYADRGGLLLGICNGFQILCEAGLLPGALARNEGVKFICRDEKLKVEKTDNPWLGACQSGEVLEMPIAHGEGRYTVDEATLGEMERNGQVLLRYQHNPNGSVRDVAGICNAEKNVFGLMPHPERASDLRSRDGLRLWTSIAKHLTQGEKAR